MKTILKIDLTIEPKQVVSMPFNSTILKLDIANKLPCLWVLSPDDVTRKIDRSFVMIEKEAGPRINESNYIGTFEAKAEVGQKTLHLFEDT